MSPVYTPPGGGGLRCWSRCCVIPRNGEEVVEASALFLLGGLRLLYLALHQPPVFFQVLQQQSVEPVVFRNPRLVLGNLCLELVGCRDLSLQESLGERSTFLNTC